MVGSRTSQNVRLLFLSGLCVFFISLPADSQMVNGLTASLANHLEYSYSTVTNQEILENWLDVDFYVTNFTTGLRLETYQPNDPSRPNPKLNDIDEGVTFRYFEYNRDNIDLRIGNYYAMFGRGLVLRTYEDRTIRVDNNLDGLKLSYSNDLLSATVLSGRPEGPALERTDLIHGADVTLRPSAHMAMGGSYVNRNPHQRNKAEIASGRMETSLSSSNWAWDLYGEYGERTNSQGTGAYLSSSFTTAGFGLSLEYKYYDRFFLTSKDGFTTFNNPPALVREHAYTLLNRNQHTLDADNEAGIQIEATFSPNPSTSLLANYSLTKNREGKKIFGDGKILQEEIYGEAEHRFSEVFYSIGALSIARQGSDTTFITPVFESSYALDATNSLRFVLQHQHIDIETLGEFDDQICSVEYSRSPTFTVSLMGERTNTSKLQKELQGVPGEKNFWLFGQVDVNISPNHDLSIIYGSRKSGFVCTGGVCRFEPEFEGLEVKFFSRL